MKSFQKILLLTWILLLSACNLLPFASPFESREDNSFSPLWLLLLGGSSSGSSRSSSPLAFVTSFVFNSGGDGELYLFRKSTTDCSLTRLNIYAVGENAFDLSYRDNVLYVSNDRSANVSMFRLDSAAQSLTSLGRVTQQSPGTSQAVPYGIAIHEDGWVFITDGSTDSNTHGSIGRFSRNSSGSLSHLDPAYVDTGAGSRMWFPALSKDSNYLYASRYDNATLQQYSVSSSSGALTALGTPTIATGNNPWEVVVHSSGSFLYVSNYGSNTIGQYSINQTSGQLTQIAAPIASGTNPIGIAVGEKFLYAGSFNNGNAGGVYGYTIDQSTGALTATAQGSIALSAPGVYGLQLDRDERCLYVARSNYAGGSADLAIYNVDQTTGALTSAGTIPAGAGPRFIKFAH
ncbi:MAG: beta-propeller fold lactonase family protein [Spirochaetales bacterium]|nr:beta-propeller fold lactonase family protein [Spirochaetales bacterium]